MNISRESEKYWHKAHPYLILKVILRLSYEWPHSMPYQYVPIKNIHEKMISNYKNIDLNTSNLCNIYKAKLNEWKRKDKAKSTQDKLSIRFIANGDVESICIAVFFILFEYLVLFNTWLDSTSDALDLLIFYKFIHSL